MNESAAALAIVDLVKCYGPLRAVDGVSLEVAPGEIVGLLGPNGAGKTSLIECALGLREPDSGRIQVQGFDVQARPDAARRRMGAVLQATALQDVVTPREALHLFGAFYERALPAPLLLERFGLLDKAEARFATLSAGQRQRLALALAFVNDPALLFLDEPTAGLDPQARRELHEAIRQGSAEGRAVLMSTHYLEEAEALCDRVAILHQGHLLATGTPAELLARSHSPTRLLVRASRPLEADALMRLPGVSAVSHQSGALALATRDSGPAILELVDYLAATGNELLDLQVRKPTLEDLFLELTGQAL